MRRFNIKNGLVCRSDYIKILNAQSILGNCIFPATGGETYDDVDYLPIFVNETKEGIKYAIDIIASVYGINVKFEEEN